MTSIDDLFGLDILKQPIYLLEYGSGWVGGGDVRRGRRASICFVFWEARERERNKRRFFFLFSSFIEEKKRNILHIDIDIVSQLVVGDERLILITTTSFIF